jgi:hypothetical protein
MSNTNPMEPGVAVNLIWGSPSHGMVTHEGLGYVVDGTVTQVETVRGGSAPITVLVHLATRTYGVSVAGQQLADKIRLPEPLLAIDTVRFFAHQLSQQNYTRREIDNVEVAVR